MLNRKIDGIIALSSFGCGPDSLMVDEISYHAKQRKIPVLNLTIDEHTGEAGFVTRLEAFVDMLDRKKRRMLEAAVGRPKLPSAGDKPQQQEVLEEDLHSLV